MDRFPGQEPPPLSPAAERRQVRVLRSTSVGRVRTLGRINKTKGAGQQSQSLRFLGSCVRSQGHSHHLPPSTLPPALAAFPNLRDRRFHRSPPTRDGGQGRNWTRPMRSSFSRGPQTWLSKLAF